MYSFSMLRSKRVVNDDSRQEIFFKMFDFLDGRAPAIFSHSIDSLKDILRGELFIAHNFVRYKGKKRKFCGELVIAPAEDFTSFVKESENKQDLRSMLVAPVSSEFDYVILVTEEPDFSLYLNNKS